MRRFLAAQFAPVLRAWRNGYEAEVRRAAIAFFLLVFLAFGVCLAVPELRLGFSAYLQHLFQGMDLTAGAGNLSPLLLLANNLRACWAASPPAMPPRTPPCCCMPPACCPTGFSSCPP